MRKENDIDFDKEIARLPYKFSDPHALDKRIDPRKLKFGSKIENGDNGGRGELFTVKEIISPTLIKLSNDLMVRLLGVAEEPSQRQHAIQFLQAKLRSQRIYLKFDRDKHDESGNLLAYVYLKNKTFINAHLARTGFVSIDTTRDFKFLEKFIRLRNGQVTKSHIDTQAE